MDKQQLTDTLRELGVENFRVSVQTQRLQISCLLAPFTHRGGTDANPSCSISFGNGTSTVHCFSGACNFQGGFSQYLSMYNQYREGDIAEIVNRIAYIERGDPSAKLDSSMKRYEQKIARNREVANKMEAWSEEELAIFTKEDRASFRAARGISLEAYEKFGLLWDGRNNRVVIPIRRFDGALVGCTGRHWCQKCAAKEKHDEHPKYYNYWNFPKARFLFNENLLDKKKPVYLVEGVFDVIRMASVGYGNTVAIMGSNISKEQAHKLRSFGQAVTLIFDGDSSGRHGTMRAIDQLRRGVLALKEVSLPDDTDPGSLSEEDLKKFVNSARLVI